MTTVHQAAPAAEKAHEKAVKFTEWSKGTFHFIIVVAGLLIMLLRAVAPGTFSEGPTTLVFVIVAFTITVVITYDFPEVAHAVMALLVPGSVALIVYVAALNDVWGFGWIGGFISLLSVNNYAMALIVTLYAVPATLAVIYSLRFCTWEVHAGHVENKATGKVIHLYQETTVQDDAFDAMERMVSWLLGLRGLANIRVDGHVFVRVGNPKKVKDALWNARNGRRPLRAGTH